MSIAQKYTRSDLEVYFYTTESFIVAGNATRQFKDELKALGGKFTFNLKQYNGACWLFSIKRLNSLKKFLKTGLVEKEEISFTAPVCMLRKMILEDESEGDEVEDISTAEPEGDEVEESQNEDDLDITEE